MKKNNIQKMPKAGQTGNGTKTHVRRSTGLILGIYTPVEWHNISKPSLKDAPYDYCWVCRKNYKSDYNKWYNKKRKILQSAD